NARREIDNATADLARLNSEAGQSGDQLDDFSRQSDRSADSTRSLGKTLLGLAVAFVSVRALTDGFNRLAEASDKYTSTAARLSLINDGLQTQEELQEKIFQAAQRSRSAYGDMADAVAKLNLLAADAFTGNDEAIRFSELMNKAFSVSGAGASEMAAGMHQLTQAMASGRLQGDEFVSINENAPLLAQAIADAMGVSRGELKKLSSEGKITADIIKASLFLAADDIEEKFKTMQVTFGQAMTMLKNEGMKAFQPLLERFNEFVNSDAFARMTEQAVAFLTVSAAALGFLFDVGVGVATALSAIAEYWPIIALGLAVIVGIYLPVMLTGLWAMLAPIYAQAVAWAVAYWPILLIIGVVVALIGILIYFGVTTEQILGFVVGLFYALGAAVWNNVANMWNILATFAEFLINLFIDPTYAVKKLFYDLAMQVVNNMASMGESFDSVADVLGKAFVAGANIAIGAVNMLGKALNMLPGVNVGDFGKMSSGTGKTISSGMKNMANSLVEPTSSKNVVAIPRMELKN
ncbi:MAG: tape measure protein, partial [Candidatus Saccharimonadales bacterium]